MSTSPDTLFGRSRRPGCRVVITGQVGVDKKPFLDNVARIARERGKSVTVAHVGDMMYAEAPDIVPGRILDLPRARLNTLRRAVFKDILASAETVENLIINTHATFRWKHGLFEAFDFDHMTALEADLYVTLVDNVDAIHERAQARDVDIVLSLRDEEFGQRHFMVRDPNGILVDVVKTIPPSSGFLRDAISWQRDHR